VSPKGPAFDLTDSILQVTITPSTTWKSSAGNFSVTASVSGGSGTYYYRWHYRYCENRTGTKYCDTVWRLFNEGSGHSTVSHMMYSTDIRQDIYVDVADSQTYPVTSSDTTFVDGPINEELQAIVPAYTLQCNLPGSYYPNQGSMWVNGQYVNGVWVNGHYVDKTYRRNACTNAKEYNPN